MPKQKLLLISSTHLAILVSIFSIGGFQFSFPKTNLKPGQKLRGSPISVFGENSPPFYKILSPEKGMVNIKSFSYFLVTLSTELKSSKSKSSHILLVTTGK
jgi:hypothetical protein